MDRPLTVIVNRSGGTARKLGDKLESTLVDAFAATQCEIASRLVEGREIAQAVRRAAQEAGEGGTVAVGGGDGTIACAAGVLAGTGTRLGVLPLGTLNHFARAIGLDGTLERAARVAAGSASDRVDLGEVEPNGKDPRVFINNCSIGLYAHMVEDRDRRRLPKALATVPAAMNVLVHRSARHVRMIVDGEEHRLKTPLLFLGNNRYELGAGKLGERASLADGRVSLYAVADRTLPGLVLSALRILVGRFDPSTDFADLAEGREIVIEGHGDHHVALDGEVLELCFPLAVRVRPGALGVMVPGGAGHEEAKSGA